MKTLLGFAAGYVLGARTGQQGLEELRKAWQEILASDEVRGLLALLKAHAQDALAQAGGSLAQDLRDAGQGKGPFAEALGGLGSADLLASWSRLAESEEVRKLVANGSALLGGVLAQALSAAQAAAAQPSAANGRAQAP